MGASGGRPTSGPSGRGERKSGPRDPLSHREHREREAAKRQGEGERAPALAVNLPGAFRQSKTLAPASFESLHHADHPSGELHFALGIG